METRSPFRARRETPATSSRSTDLQNSGLPGTPNDPADESREGEDVSLAIRELPSARPRVETGPVQFGDDWPGVFLRGDFCMPCAWALRDLKEQGAIKSLSPLVSLLEMLKASRFE